jgi:hypothetical protein
MWNSSVQNTIHTASHLHVSTFFGHHQEVIRKQYPPDDGRKGPKHVGSFLYDFIYFYTELLCSCWNKRCKTVCFTERV